MIIVETFERSAHPEPRHRPKRAQDRDAMTPITALSHCPPAGNLASGAASGQGWLVSRERTRAHLQ
jgi:hypothetical protein